MRRILIRTFIVIALLVVISAIGLASIAAYVSLAAERRLHATELTIEITAQYVRNHQGSWPPSWPVLERVSLSFGGFSPEQIHGAQNDVVIDFSFDPDSLVGITSPEEFKAIRPNGPCYMAYEFAINDLLQAIKETRLARKGNVSKNTRK